MKDLMVLTVKTDGPPGSGKSTAMRLIEKALAERFTIIDADMDVEDKTAIFTLRLNR